MLLMPAEALGGSSSEGASFSQNTADYLVSMPKISNMTHVTSI